LAAGQPTAPAWRTCRLRRARSIRSVALGVRNAESSWYFLPYTLIFLFVLSGQRPAAVRRQMNPHRAALPDALGGWSDDAQLRAVLGLNHIIPAAAGKDLPHHRNRHHVLGLRRLCGRDRDVMRADRHRRAGVGLHRLADAGERHTGEFDPHAVETPALDDVAGADEAG